MARSKNKQKRKRMEFKKKRDRKTDRKKSLKAVAATTKRPSAKK
jgi:hypothetical protein